MKKSLAIFILSLFSITNTGCDNDDSVTVPFELEGEWNMVNVSGGILGIDVDFEANEVVWNFNLNRGEVRIENSISTQDPRQIFSGLSSGTYSFELKKIQNVLILFINGNRMGFLFVSNTILSINDGVATDGFITEFERLR